MRISVSNIAWNKQEDANVVRLLQHYEIDAIDIAPGKYFPDIKKVSSDEIAAVRQYWYKHNIEIIGMQSLLFGTQGLNLFSDKHIQQQMLQYLEAVCRIGANLGATKLVFGSPKNRDCLGLTESQTHSIAVDFFNKLGNIARNYGVIICLEPNPVCYGANFMTNSVETAAIVKAVNHPAIQMQFDSGALIFNQEDAESILSQYVDIIGHIHLSEPGLVPIGDINSNHENIATVLKTYCKGRAGTIEMLAASKESHISALERAIAFVIKYYR